MPLPIHANIMDQYLFPFSLRRFLYVSCGVRTHAQLPAVDLKSTPLTTRANWPCWATYKQFRYPTCNFWCCWQLRNQFWGENGKDFVAKVKFAHFFLAKDPAALATLWQHKYFLAEHLKNCGSLFAFDNCIQPAVKILSTSGLVAMTSALHAEGRQFDPGLV